jgi:NADPH:quinone reductase
MRAGWYEKVGPAAEVLQVGEMPRPEPGMGEVRVRIAFSGINPSDVKARGGWRGPAMPFPRVVPHSDGAGVIDKVGAQVPAARVGERVWLFNAAWRRPFGTCAEYAVVPMQQAVTLPAGVPLDAAACLGIPALTAHRSVFCEGPVAGKVVLVAGGAGMVGYYAVQLAKWGGASLVVATVSSAEKAAVAREAGADLVLNYRSDGVAARAREATGGQGVDHVVEVDLGANLALDLELLRHNGAIASYASMGKPAPELPFYAMNYRNLTLRTVLVYSLPPDVLRQGITDVTRWLAGGQARHRIAGRFLLAQLAQAHVAAEDPARIGQVLVDCGA